MTASVAETSRDCLASAVLGPCGLRAANSGCLGLEIPRRGGPPGFGARATARRRELRLRKRRRQGREPRLDVSDDIVANVSRREDESPDARRAAVEALGQTDETGGGQQAAPQRVLTGIFEFLEMVQLLPPILHSDLYALKGDQVHGRIVRCPCPLPPACPPRRLLAIADAPVLCKQMQLSQVLDAAIGGLQYGAERSIQQVHCRLLGAGYVVQRGDLRYALEQLDRKGWLALTSTSIRCLKRGGR